MSEKCVYCGEREATKEIGDPNGSPKMWKICDGCDRVIKQQQKLSFGHLIARISEHEPAKEFGTKMVIEAEQELKKLAEEEGLDSFTAHIFKKEKLK